VAEIEAPETTVYKLETLVPLVGREPEGIDAGEHAAALGMYLLDLMAAQEYEVTGGVWFEVPEPEAAPYPEGWAVLRALVEVREFDVDVDPDDADDPLDG
jgi:hypothetical protein